MAPIRKSRSMRDLAFVSSTSFTASTSSSSQVTPQDSRALVVYENNHNNVLSDVDEDDDDDNDIYYNQDEQGVVNHAEEQFYSKKIQELAKRQFKRFLRGELVLDPKKKKKQVESFGIQDNLYACEDELASNKSEMQIYKHQNVASSSRRPHKLVNGEDDKLDRKKKKKQIESFGIQDDLYACEDELVSKQYEMQIYKHHNVASSSKRPHKLVNDEDDKLDQKKKKNKKQIETFGIQDDLYACEDELVSKQIQIYKHQKVASSSKRSHKYVYDEDDEDDEEEYNVKKKQRNKASSSKHPHKSVKDDNNEEKNTKNKLKKKIEPIISNDITEGLKEHITHQLNGTNIMLVIQKPLYLSDLAESQSRLSMPYNQLETSAFLTEQEREYLLIDKTEIDVSLLGPSLQMFNKSMKLTRWQINSTQSYILRTGWKTFVDENKDDMKLGATIQVWSYRNEDQNGPCFAIAVVKRAD